MTIYRQWMLIVAVAGLTASAHRAEAQAPPASQPATSPASASLPSGPSTQDPFAALRVVRPKNTLQPVRSVRIRDAREARKSKKIQIAIRSSPSGAMVTHGGRALGKTPLTLSAPRNSTPLDIVIRMRGKMTVRSRVMRRSSRSYFFKLHPAKL